MAGRALFPTAPARAGMYESFYLRTVCTEEPVGAWIRYTAHKRPGRRATGSLWCTVFDARRGAPFMHKLSGQPLRVPENASIAIGERASLGPSAAQGDCGPASWSLRFSSAEPELRHLSPEWLYRAPLPRTKLTSPLPAASFDGVLQLAGREAIELHGWPGMVGHNWGSEHAERWIWLHGVGFAEAPEAWLDLALGRLKLAGRMTPWVANGVLCLDGHRHRLGGAGARGTRVVESAQGCHLRLAGADGLSIEARVAVPRGTAAGWLYADPDGGEHDVVNCSIAGLELELDWRDSRTPRTLSTSYGGAYELGMRERAHGVQIAPFADT